MDAPSQYSDDEEEELACFYNHLSNHHLLLPSHYTNERIYIMAFL